MTAAESPDVMSALYVGHVTHRRCTPLEHRFRFPLQMFYLDLDELDGLFHGRWFWSHRRPAPIRFRRADYFGNPQASLSESVRAAVELETGHRPEGSIRLLTQLRSFGYVFNPISLYYCFDASDRLEAVLAEVTSTPWKERCSYVLPAAESGAPSATTRWNSPKKMHVSPFMGMDLRYEFTLQPPERSLSLSIACHSPDDTHVFDAALSLERRAFSTRSLAWAALRYPAMAGQVIAGIHWQALKLWWKGAPFHSHPESLETGHEAAQ